MMTDHPRLRDVLVAALLIWPGLAGADAAGHVFRFDDVAWQETGLDGAEMAILWGSEEEGDAIWAFRIQPGVAIPPHTHSNDYWGIAVQGNWVHVDADGNEVVTGQDSYTRIRAGALHGDRCQGPEVCINILDFAGARDIAFPE